MRAKNAVCGSAADTLSDAIASSAAPAMTTSPSESYGHRRIGMHDHAGDGSSSSFRLWLNFEAYHAPILLPQGLGYPVMPT